MQRELTRRSLLALGATGTIVGLSGCIGGNDDTATDEQPSDGATTNDASAGEASGSADEAQSVTGRDGAVTLHHTPQTGFYEFEFSEDDTGGQGTISRVLWNVTEATGHSGRVDAAVQYDDRSEEVFSFTTNADAHELLFNDEFGLADLGFTTHAFFPGRRLEGFDLSKLAAGGRFENELDFMGQSGLQTFIEVVDKEEHAGIEGYVLRAEMGAESDSFDEIMENASTEWCISPEHALVIRGTDGFDRPRRPLQEFRLVSYGPPIDFVDRPEPEIDEDPIERGATSDGRIHFVEPGYYEWEIFMGSLDEPDFRRIAIAEEDGDVTAVIEWDIGGDTFTDEVSGRINDIGEQLFASQGAGRLLPEVYALLGDHDAGTFTVGDSALDQNLDRFRYTVTGTETIQGLECYTIDGEDTSNDLLVFEGALSLETGAVGAFTQYDESGTIFSDRTLIERSSTIPDGLAGYL